MGVRPYRLIAAGGLAIVVAVGLAAAQLAGTYAPPRPGWLYVPDSNAYGLTGRVLAVDPEGGEIKWTLPTGHLPDVAVAPDGSRLYVASSVAMPDGDNLVGVLEVIDTLTGQVVQRVDNPDRALSTARVYPSSMAVSRDGRWLFQYKMHLDRTTDYTSYYVETFDTETGIILSKTAEVPLCSGALLLPGAARQTLNVVCSHTADVRLLTLRPDGASADAKPPRVALSGGGHEHPGTAFVDRGSSTLTVIMGEGRFHRANAATAGSLGDGVLDQAARRVEVPAAGPSTRAASRQDWLAQGRIRQQVPVLTPDGAQLYVGISGRAQGSPPSFSEIAVIDTGTMNRIRSINPNRPLASFTLSTNGRRLYGVDSDARTLVVLDAATGSEVRTISGVGVSPVFAIVAP